MSFQVDFVSPEEILYSGIGSMVVARTRGGGDIAFLTGHEPFIGSLVPSEVRVLEEEGDTKAFAVRGGFVSVTKNKVTVLSDEAIAVEGINVEAAQVVADRARSDLADDPEDHFAADDLAWAELQLELAAGSSPSH